MNIDKMIAENKARVTDEAAAIVANLKSHTYLGDGLYAGADDIHVWLYTDEGFGPTNLVALNESTYRNLLSYVRNVLANESE